MEGKIAHCSMLAAELAKQIKAAKDKKAVEALIQKSEVLNVDIAKLQEDLESFMKEAGEALAKIVDGES